MRKITLDGLMNPMWRRVASLLMVIMFIDLSDAILSDWVPGYMQGILGSSLLMGFAMSFSSVVGFVADLLFPQLMKNVLVNQLLKWAMGASLLFSTSLYIVSLKPLLPVLLFAMAVWGIYYEFLTFANQQFVADVAGSHDRSRVWSIIGVFRNFAYFLGPILGGLILSWWGDGGVILTSAVITVVSLVLMAVMRMSGDSTSSRLETESVNLFAEIKHWWVLLEHVWPVVMISLVLGLIDSTFWTTGTVLSDALANQHQWGGMFLPLYMLPSLFVGFIVAKWGIYKGKKKWAEVFLLLGGLMFAGIGISSNVYWQLLAVFLGSCMLSVSYPLTDAVYSDIVSRMGRERKHMVGLSSSTVSLAYIVGPVLAGLIASRVGERMTFSSMGVGVAVVAWLLLIITPKKIKLPQAEIGSWE